VHAQFVCRLSALTPKWNQTPMIALNQFGVLRSNNRPSQKGESVAMKYGLIVLWLCKPGIECRLKFFSRLRYGAVITHDCKTAFLYAMIIVLIKRIYPPKPTFV
jgi:hypothetical protein